MKTNNIKLNYIYNLMFQIFSMITPLITTPYVSRVLSPVGIGKFSFSASINTYFCLLAGLGFSFYAQREVAKNQGDISKQSKTFWEIVICKTILGALTFLLSWILILSGIFGEYSLLIKIMSIEIIGVTFNISFFFQGNENFGLIALRDFIVRIIGIIFIFIFVNDQSDLWLYALCNSITVFVSALSLWPCLKKKIVKINVVEVKPLHHFLPSIRLFIPTIAISIYTILDKTLIGVLIPGTVELQRTNGIKSIERLADIENGYYAQSEKIIKMAMTVIASLGTVMMPRNAKVLADGDNNTFYYNIKNAISFVFFIGAPLCAGIAAIAFNLSPWFFGPEYEKVPVLMCIFAFMIIPSGIGNVLGQQYLIPKGEDKNYAISYVLSAIINLGLNIVLIPKMLSYGAAIASVIAEFAAPITMLYLTKNSIVFFPVLNENKQPLVASAIMFLIVRFTSELLQPTLVNTCLLIIEGICVYVVFVIVMKYPLVTRYFEVIKNWKEKKNG